MYVNFCLRILTKSFAIPQQLYKPASRGLSAIAELLVFLLSVYIIMFELAASVTNISYQVDVYSMSF